MTIGNPDIKISKEEIYKQVDKICQSSELITKSLLCKLLRYVVNETIAGREDNIKGYTIGVEIFNKEKNFDPEQDPLVRIHAGRLRRALKLYYLENGKHDPIRIEMPKGRYIPFFFENSLQDEINSLPKQEKPKQITKPTLAILPFKNLSGDAAKDYFALGFSEELSVELTKYEDLVVFDSMSFLSNSIPVSDKYKIILEKGIRFIVEGSVHLTDDRIKVLVRLTDLMNEEQIWAERYLRDLSAENLIDIQENITTEISAVIGSEYGIILQCLASDIVHQKPQKLETIHAISRFHYFEACQTIEAAQEAFESLEQAITLDQHSGIAHAMLAVLYGNRYVLDFPGADVAYERMLFLAEKALSLDPNSIGVRSIFAGICFVSNKRDRFFQEAEICLAQNPRPSVRLGLLSFYIALAGDWDRGKEILDSVMKIKISFPLYYYGVTSLFYYRKGEYELAHMELIKYNVPYLFWPYLQRAAVLGQLNRLDEAKPEIARLKQLKPDFEEKAEYLISRFIKEKELLELLLEGLRKAGMFIQ